jgi:hypothetical protein
MCYIYNVINEKIMRFLEIITNIDVESYVEIIGEFENRFG